MPFEIDRRRFVANLTGSVLTWTIFSGARASPSAEPRIDAKRLQGTLEELSTFGRPAGGSFADGVSRVAYSDADVAGRAYVMGLMKAAGLDPVIDPAGNIIGRRAGRDRAARPILMGSHIDSVLAPPGTRRAGSARRRPPTRMHSSSTDMHLVPARSMAQSPIDRVSVRTLSHVSPAASHP